MKMNSSGFAEVFHQYTPVHCSCLLNTKPTRLQHANFAACFQGQLGIVEQGLEVTEAERHTTHDALSCITCQEHVIGVVRQANQNCQLCLSEVLCLIHKHLETV